jgi:hypothetical protein
MAENEWSDEFRPEDAPRRPDPSRDQWEEGPPQKAGMSGGMKAFLILVAVIGCCCILCCGVLGYVGYSFVPKVSHNEAEINAARDDMGNIQLPAGFKPDQLMKFDNFMMTMAVVTYRNPAAHGEITMASMRLNVGDRKQQDQALRQQLDRQGVATPKRLTNTKTETKTIEIKGKECPFNFTKGQEQGTKTKMHEVSGVFDGNHGPVMINIEMDDSAYKEDAVVKMLEGIK